MACGLHETQGIGEGKGKSSSTRTIHSGQHKEFILQSNLQQHRENPLTCAQ